MTKYQKIFNFNTAGNASTVGNVCNLLYDVCDWIVSLGIGFTSYRKETYDSSKERHFQCFLTHKNLDYEWCLELYSNFTFDDDGNITGLYTTSSKTTNSYFCFYSFGTYNTTIKAYTSQSISTETGYEESWNQLIQVTIYYFDDNNILFGVETRNNISTEGFNGCTAMFLTSGTNKFYTTTRIALTQFYNSTSAYGYLTYGIGYTHMFKTILDSCNIKLIGKAMLLKIPILNYKTQLAITATEIDFEGENQLHFDRLFQTNKYGLNIGAVYTIDGNDYLCINERDGIMIKC